MATYRICKRTFYSTLCSEWLSYYYVDKKILFFWHYISGLATFKTIEEAENWILSNRRNKDMVIKEVCI